MGFFFLTHLALFLTFSWRTNCDPPLPSTTAPLRPEMGWAAKQSLGPCEASGHTGAETPQCPISSCFGVTWEAPL